MFFSTLHTTKVNKSTYSLQPVNCEWWIFWWHSCNNYYPPM